MFKMNLLCNLFDNKYPCSFANNFRIKVNNNPTVKILILLLKVLLIQNNILTVREVYKYVTA